jgi:hypothetical protein
MAISRGDRQTSFDVLSAANFSCSLSEQFVSANGIMFRYSQRKARSENGADGISDIEGKATRVGASEWSRGDASDIDGQTGRSKWAGAHESPWVANEFQIKIKKQASRGEVLVRIHGIGRGPKLFWYANQ